MLLQFLTMSPFRQQIALGFSAIIQSMQQKQTEESILRRRRYQLYQQRLEIATQALRNSVASSALAATILQQPQQPQQPPQPQRRRPKAQGFWDDVFPYLSDEIGGNSFSAHFRMKRATFNQLVQRLQQHPAFSNEAPNSIPVERQVAIAIWRLANNDGIRVMEQTLGVSQVNICCDSVLLFVI
jgi:hypothetical protein